MTLDADDSTFVALRFEAEIGGAWRGMALAEEALAAELSLREVQLGVASCELNLVALVGSFPLQLLLARSELALLGCSASLLFKRRYFAPRLQHVVFYRVFCCSHLIVYFDHA